MAVPTCSASLDKPAYAVGETMTLTVSYSDADTQQVSVTVQIADKAGNTSAPVTCTAVIDPSTVTTSDSSGRVWTKQSDTGSVAVFTAVA